MGSKNSDSEPARPWIHIGNCTVCKEGLARVRVCGPTNGSRHLYALCDECEVYWLTPDISAKPQASDPEKSTCPVCGDAMYGQHSAWATTSDLESSDWQSQVTVE